MFFITDIEFVNYYKSQYKIDLGSLEAHRNNFKFQPEKDNISLFDSKVEELSLPEHVLRFVAFKFTNLQYGSSTGVILLFLIERFEAEDVLLVSFDTSYNKPTKHIPAMQHKLECVEELGRSITRSLTEYNKISIPPISTLHIPKFPSKLQIRSRISHEALIGALVAGMAIEQTPLSPIVELQSMP